MAQQSISLNPAAQISPMRRAVLAGFGLGLAADLLLYGHWGAGTFVFFALLSLAIGWCGLASGASRRAALAALIGVAAALPLLETADGFGATGLALFGLGLAAAVAADLWDRTLASLPGLALRFGLLAPLRLPLDLARALSQFRLGDGWARFARPLALWVVPLALAGLFLALFSEANPLIEAFLAGLRPGQWVDGTLGPHLVLFGLGIAFAWPFLVPRLLPWRERMELIGPTRPVPLAILFGRDMVLRALILFNLLFLVETGLDLSYLWAGLSLPDGMTYAEYAHRGAYPLVVTALIAAGFVLLAFKPGSATESDRPVRLLVFAFLAQNLLLVASSLLRLELYVGVYALTQFRLAAGLWMLLVAIGLVLIFWRILRRRSNSWLVGANLVSLLALCLVTTLVDLDREIARFNLAHAEEAGAAGQPLHVDYLYELSPTILPDLDAYLAGLSPDADGLRRSLLDLRAALRDRRLAIADWRDWSWRGARLDAYLATLSLPMDAATWPTRY